MFQGCQNSYREHLTKAEMLSAQSRNFVAITIHLTNNFSKEELFIAKAEERRINAQANLARIKSEKRKGQFVEEKKISQKVKNVEKNTRSWSDFGGNIQIKSD
jgi:hypothetical protein